MHRKGLRAWVGQNLRGRKGQQGFTLIELLVVVTILGVLAGIVTLSLVGLTTNASIQSCNTEYKTVQAALDAYMANNNTPPGSLPAATTATHDMTNPVTLYVANNVSATNPNYTRNGTTQFFYTWDGNGKINGIFDANGNDMQPKGCKVT